MLAFFRVNLAKSSNQPDFFIRDACFDPSSGQPRVDPRKQEGGGGAKKIEKSTSFLFEVSRASVLETLAAALKTPTRNGYNGLTRYTYIDIYIYGIQVH